MSTMSSFLKHYFLSILFLGGLLLAACSPETPSNSEAVPSPSGIFVTWERSGGIAGICQRLTISPNQSYVAQDCDQGETLGQGQVPEEDWSQLDTWQQEYQAFEWNFELPPGSADMFNDSFRFSGNGMGMPSETEQEAINTFLADLFSRLGESRE